MTPPTTDRKFRPDEEKIYAEDKQHVAATEKQDESMIPGRQDNPELARRKAEKRGDD
jgi:hypothetical protein